MRITSNTYTDLLIASSQQSQQKQATLQIEISTGNNIQSPSDNSIAYGQAVRTQTDLARLNAYSNAVSLATTATTQNNSAMTSLHQIVAQASTLATGVNSTLSASDMQAQATQVDSLLQQLASVVNQKDYNNNYLFGGTSNQQPLDPTTFAYNSSTNAVAATINVDDNTPIHSGILAGRPGSPGVNGFLYNSSTGVDVVAALKNLSADLKAGNANAVQTTDVPAINKALDNISIYVGSTAADMTAVKTTGNLITQQVQNDQQNVSSLTQVNLPDALVQLQQVQQQYQASLSAGTRILSLSILNYMSSIPA